MAQWEWRQDDGKFGRFPVAAVTELEKAWAAHSGKLPLVVGAHTYAVDLSLMTQTNTATGKMRYIRRRGPTGELTSRVPVWQWEGAKGEWHAYDGGASDVIEKAYLRDDLKATVKVHTGAHELSDLTVHFIHMHQTIDGEKFRSVRRFFPARPETVQSAPPRVPSSPKKRPRSPAAAPATNPAPPPPAATASAAAPSSATTGLSSVIATAPLVGTPVQPWPCPAVAEWQTCNTLFVLDAHTRHSRAGFSGEQPVVAATFDLDHTLVAPKNGKRFAKGADDWDWVHPSVPKRLLELHTQGYWVVIFSNQSGMSDASKAAAFRQKIVSIQKAAGLPISAFAATGHDSGRKPGVGMWRWFCDNVCAGRTVDQQRSFYIGDAAGRTITTLTGDKKDFACSDRKFAVNARLQFATPEEFFLQQPAASFHWDGWGPKDIDAIIGGASATPLQFHAAGKEVVVLVGWPGSGKSTFFRRYLQPHGYAWANKDTHKTRCAKVAGEALAKGSSVCIDNTNPSAKARAEWVKLAAAHQATVRCIFLQTPRRLAGHMNFVRAAMGIADYVPDIGYNMYNKYFEEPSTSEGFASVEKVSPPVTFEGLPPGAQEAFRMLS